MSAPETAQTFFTPTEVGAILKLSPRSVIARFAGMQGVLTLPAEDSRLTKRDRYRTLRIPKHVLDRFIETNTIQASTPTNIAKNQRKVRRIRTDQTMAVAA
jgi:hypothetical protein